MFQESILLDQDQDKTLTKTDAIITRAGYKYQIQEYDDDSLEDDPYSDYDPAPAQAPRRTDPDRVNFDTGIPMGIREMPMG